VRGAQVFSRSKDGDGIGRLRLVLIGDLSDLLVHPDEPTQRHEQEEC
jgi:hypothetical protein